MFQSFGGCICAEALNGQCPDEHELKSILAHSCLHVAPFYGIKVVTYVILVTFGRSRKGGLLKTFPQVCRVATLFIN